MKSTINSNDNKNVSFDFYKEDDFHIGIVIKHLRLEKHMTQDQVSDGICSTKYLRALEKGLNNPSTYIITLLSERLNVDIYNYYRNIKESGDIETFDIISEINKSLRELNTQLTEELVNKYKDQPKLLYGQPYQQMCYFKAMIQFYNYHDYKKTIQYCIQGLEYFHKDFDVMHIEKSIFSITELAMINAIGISYGSMNEIEKAYTIFSNLVDYTKNYTLNNKFTYIRNSNSETALSSATANLIECLNIFGRYQEALDQADEGIKIFAQLKNLTKVNLIYLQRMVAAHNLGKDDITKESYNYCMMFFHILHDKEYLVELQHVISKYPGIKKIVGIPDDMK